MRSTPSSPPRVLVADAANATRDRLCAWISESTGAHAYAVASDAESVRRGFEAHRPDCVVIDAPLHDHRGFALLTELRDMCPYCLLIVLVNDNHRELRRRVCAAGADYCLDKSQEFERVAELVTALGSEA